jgi:hypothetical protein
LRERNSLGGAFTSSVKVEEGFDVKKRAGELDCSIPNLITILPRNFANAKSKEELVYEDEAPTIRTLWRTNGIVETPLEKKGERIPYVVEESFEWVGPMIFIASQFITQNPSLVDTAISIISTYLLDWWFKGLGDNQKKARLKVIVETKTGTYKEVDYEGPPGGLSELPKIIRSLHDEE